MMGSTPGRATAGAIVGAARLLWLVLGAATLCSCATLNTSRMTPACREYYNACLDSCVPRTRSPRDDMPMRPGEQRLGEEAFSPEIPGCVEQCNERGRACQRSDSPSE